MTVLERDEKKRRKLAPAKQNKIKNIFKKKGNKQTNQTKTTNKENQKTREQELKRKGDNITT